MTGAKFVPCARFVVFGWLARRIVGLDCSGNIRHAAHLGGGRDNSATYRVALHAPQARK